MLTGVSGQTCDLVSCPVVVGGQLTEKQGGRTSFENDWWFMGLSGNRLASSRVLGNRAYQGEREADRFQLHFGFFDTPGFRKLYSRPTALAVRIGHVSDAIGWPRFTGAEPNEHRYSRSR